MIYVNILVLEWGENQKDLDDAKTNLKEVETKLLEYEFILETFKQSVFRTSVIKGQGVIFIYKFTVK